MEDICTLPSQREHKLRLYELRLVRLMTCIHVSHSNVTYKRKLYQRISRDSCIPCVHHHISTDYMYVCTSPDAYKRMTWHAHGVGVLQPVYQAMQERSMEICCPFPPLCNRSCKPRCPSAMHVRSNRRRSRHGRGHVCNVVNPTKTRFGDG